jgi:hypothetical protein
VPRDSGEVLVCAESSRPAVIHVYLAWCAAAIVLPITAGRLLDLTQGYGEAVPIAAGGNVLGVLVALGLPSQGTSLRRSRIAGRRPVARRPTTG